MSVCQAYLNHGLEWDKWVLTHDLFQGHWLLMIHGHWSSTTESTELSTLYAIQNGVYAIQTQRQGWAEYISVTDERMLYMIWISDRIQDYNKLFQ